MFRLILLSYWIVILLIHLLSPYFTLIRHQTGQLPLPTMQQINASKSIKLDNSTTGLMLYSFVSDIHVGSTGFPTENLTVLLEYVKVYYFFLLLFSIKLICMLFFLIFI
jgi:hypothetical protein